jgi:drug/metabolite transporter (DMT)-like permease
MVSDGGYNPLFFHTIAFFEQLMNVGLIYTAASVYQMLRGAVVIFTGVFSYFFLKRRMTRWQWISLFLVVAGVSIVGLSSVLYPQERPSVFGDEDDVPFDWQSFLGVVFVLGAQILTATQFVVEEKIMSRYHVKPLRAVGLEGSFGLLSVLAGMPILYAIYGNSRPFFDIPRGWHQITGNPAVWGTGIAIAFSIAFFNFFGLSITTTVSATARSTIDTCR